MHWGWMTLFTMQFGFTGSESLSGLGAVT